MRRAAFMTGLAVALALVVTPAHSQKSSAACTLLQVAEIESALGGKAAKSPSGASHSDPGMAMDTCSVQIKVPGKGGSRTVSILVMKNLPMAGAEAVRVRNAGRAREPQWKVPGARMEEKTLGDAICTIYGRPGIAAHSTCTIPRGKGYLEVDVTVPDLDEVVPMDTVGALVKKAATRL
jgi:hypothetical protein